MTLREVRATAAQAAHNATAEQHPAEPAAEAALAPDSPTTIDAPQLGVAADFSGYGLDEQVELAVADAGSSAVTSVSAETGGAVVSDPVEITATTADGKDVSQFPAELVDTRGGDDKESPVVSDVLPGIALEFEVDEDRVRAEEIDTSTLRIYTREEAGDPWEQLPSYFDAETGTVKGESSHLSQFIVIGIPFVVPPGPAIVLDPDNDEAEVTTPGPATELPYNMALARGLEAMFEERCNAVVTITRSADVPMVSRETRAAIAAAADPVLTLGIGFNSWLGTGWGTTTDGGTQLYSRGRALDEALTASLVNSMPGYTGRPANRLPANADFPHPEFGGLPGAFTHIEALFLDHSYDRPVIDNGFSYIVSGAYTGMGTYLESQGFDCSDPVTGGWPAKPSKAELERWRHLGYQNYQLYGGDPVSFSTGNLVEDEPLFELPGVGGQVTDLTLVYNSQDGRASRVGAGWSMEVSSRAQRFDDGSVLVARGDGASYVFESDGAGGYTAGDGMQLSLREAGEGKLELRSVDGESWVFDAADIDGIGELVTHTDRQGNSTTLGYGTPDDDDGFVPLVSITDEAGQTIRVSADDAGRVSGFTHPDGRTWALAYDGAGNLTSITAPDGRVRSFSYDGEHRLLTATDAEGVLYLENVYDGAGRIVTQWDAERNVRTFDYSTPGETVYTDNEGQQTTFRFDDDFRITAVIDALGNEARYVFDDAGQVVRYTDEAGRVWNYTYDANGNVASELLPDGSEIAYTYTPTGELASVTDEGGPDGSPRTTVFEVDPLGLTTAVNRADGNIESVVYDAHGDPVSLTSAAGATTTMRYDARGNLIETVDAEGAVTTSTYDAANRVTSETDASGATTRFEWDAGDRLTRQIDPLGGVTAYTYDGNDQVVSRTEPDGAVTTYEWDELARLVSMTAADGGVTRYEYNGEDELTAVVDPIGARTEFQLDSLYRPVAVTDPLGGEWKRAFDPTGVLIGSTDALGGETTTTLDELGRAVATTDAAGATTSVAYDTVGRVTRTTDALGNEVSYSYDVLDRLVSTTDQIGAQTSLSYDADGNLIETIDRAGVATSIAYDDIGRPVSVTDALDGVSHFGYDAVGNLTSVSDALGHSSTFEYDPLRRVTASTDPLGAESTVAYDALGQVIATTDANGHSTSFGYDPVGRVVASTDATGGESTFAYDLAGRQISTVDPLGTETRFAYDAAGQLTQVVEGAVAGQAGGPDVNITSSYAYDALGNLVTSTDPNGNQTEFAYDELSRLVTETNAAGGRWSYDYDDAGRVTWMQDPNGVTTTYGYDARGDVVSTAFPGQEIGYEYDVEQRLVAMTDALGASGWIYDELGRVTEQIDVNGSRLGYAYDAVGQLTALTMPDGSEIGYSYDDAGRVSAQTSPWGDIAYGWDPVANLTSLERSTGVVSTYEYDAADRVASIVHATPAPTAAAEPASPTVEPLVRGEDVSCLTSSSYLGDRDIPAAGGGVACLKTAEYVTDRVLPEPVNPVADGDQLRFDYERDAAGNVVSATRTIGPEDATSVPAPEPGDGDGGVPAPTQPDPADPAPADPSAAEAVSETRSFSYDAVSRLVGSESTSGETNAYGYDAAGNRTSWTSTGGASEVDVTAQFNALNQLTGTSGSTSASFGYDAAGNRTSQSVDGVSTSLSYDATGRTTTIDRSGRSTTFGYDGLGRQSTSTDTTEHGSQTTEQVWNGTQVVSSSNSAHGRTSLMRDALGELALQSSDSGEKWALLDGLGSTAAQAVGGSVTQLASYSDWGVQGFESSAWDAALSFTGEQSDAGYGTSVFYARQYDPVSGVWSSPDAWRGLLSEPATLHRYAYVVNNPASLTDALGFCYQNYRTGQYEGVNCGRNTWMGGGIYSSSGYPSYAPPATRMANGGIKMGHLKRDDRVGTSTWGGKKSTKGTSSACRAGDPCAKSVRYTPVVHDPIKTTTSGPGPHCINTITICGPDPDAGWAGVARGIEDAWNGLRAWAKSDAGQDTSLALGTLSIALPPLITRFGGVLGLHGAAAAAAVGFVVGYVFSGLGAAIDCVAEVTSLSCALGLVGAAAGPLSTSLWVSAKHLSLNAAALGQTAWVAEKASGLTGLLIGLNEFLRRRNFGLG